MGLMTMKDHTRSYEEMLTLQTFEQRFNYLNLHGKVGRDTFGFDRYLNQLLYHSKEWRDFRRQIILRDNGCDLGIEGHEIQSKAIIHHINPITVDDVINHSEKVFDPSNVITTSHRTHNAIHYGDSNQIEKDFVERKPNDTCPWRK